jgi:hypothetical protein
MPFLSRAHFYWLQRKHTMWLAQPGGQRFPTHKRQAESAKPFLRNNGGYDWYLVPETIELSMFS